MQKNLYRLCLTVASFAVASSYALTVTAGQPQQDQIVVEALLRMGQAGVELVRGDRQVQDCVNRYLESHKSDPVFLETVSRLQLTEHSEELQAFLKPEVDASQQVEAIRLLIQNGAIESLKHALNQKDDIAVVIANGLGFVDGPVSQNLLQSLVFMLSLIDHNGDLIPDRKEVLFTGIGGVEHDHGIHAFVPGPDGKLYFNFGNEGHQIKDANGQPIVDLSGRVVADHGKPYQQGMVFRCDPDGSNVETLAWNFRNNWEVCVDSFGTMWQSDNDDDGNRATRINYVMPYGNYGYRGELDGASWSVPRTGMHENVSLRHWHLNDPGVVPNAVQTGAGSPTGITKYEGDLLPPRFQNQLIHCDPGPNSVRAFQLTQDGAGYSGEQIPLMTGTADKLFRPVDVCVAPDGSLFVADWYDPGVGGHRMGDTQRGRIFHVTRSTDSLAGRGNKKNIAESRWISQLKSPNPSARFLGAHELREMGLEAHRELHEMIESSATPAHRARALWVLAHSAPQQATELALNDKNADVRCVGVRIAKQYLDDETIVRLAGELASDASAKVRREAVLSLRDCKAMASAWTQLAILHDGQDRWYLEALGIAAEGNWDNCLNTYLAAVGNDWNTPATRDIIWRSRSEQTSQWLGKRLTQLQSEDHATRFLRAFDFQSDSPSKQTALRDLVRTLATKQQ